MKIPRIVWIGAAAIAAAFVVYKAILRPSDTPPGGSGGSGGTSRTPPSTGSGLRVSYNSTLKSYDVTDLSRSKVIARALGEWAMNWVFVISGDDYSAQMFSPVQRVYIWPKSSEGVREFRL